MNIVDFVKVLAITFISFFPVLNPVGGAPTFLSLTRNYSQGSQKVLARKIADYGFALLAVSIWNGLSTGISQILAHTATR